MKLYSGRPGSVVMLRTVDFRPTAETSRDDGLWVRGTDLSETDFTTRHACRTSVPAFERAGESERCLIAAIHLSARAAKGSETT